MFQGLGLMLIFKTIFHSKKRGLINYLKLIVQELNYKSKEYNIEFEDKVRKLNAILISFDEC